MYNVVRTPQARDAVAAVYLSGLLLESGVLGLGQYTVSTVALQRASSGAPLDDVIISGTDAAGESATLHLQVKSTLHIGDGPTNTDFREIVSKAWATVRGGDSRNIVTGLALLSAQSLKPV